MIILVVAAIPAVLALFVWALTDLERFVTYAVLGSIAFPMTLARPGGTNVDAADLFLLIALASWLLNQSLHRAPDPQFKRTKFFPAVLTYWAVTAMSIAWSVKVRSTAIFSVQLLEFLVLYPLLLASIPSSTASVRRGLMFLLKLTTGLSVATLIGFAFRGSGNQLATALPGFNKNGLGCFTAAAAILAFAFWTEHDPRGGRWRYAVAALIGFAATLATESRGAMLGLIAAIVLISFLLARRRPSVKVVALVVVAVLGSVYFTVVAPERQTLTNRAGAYDSTTLRLQTWTDGIHKIEQRPWLGTGARTYADHIEGGILPDPNNLFLLTWAELGVPGLVALLLLLYSIARLIQRAARLPPDAAVLGVAAAGVVVSLLVHFQVDISWVRGETTLEFAMIGIILSVLRLTEPNRLADTHMAPAVVERLRTLRHTRSRPEVLVGSRASS
jgi:O-antigen ligase